MKQRLRFGRGVSLGRVALRGAIGGKLQVTMPKFGPHCVCCNADTMGRTQDYDPSTDRIRMPAIAMPVCFACKDHALNPPFAPIMQALGGMVGIALAGAGIGFVAKRPHDPVLWGTAVVGTVLALASLAWARATRRRIAAARRDGHHPGLELSVQTGTLLDTENEALVEELLALNPDAHRLPTPLLWRRRGEGMPKARVVASQGRDEQDRGGEEKR